MTDRPTSDIDKLAHLLDSQFRLPGTRLRFGLDSLIGLIPGIGDALTGGLGLYIVNRARQEGAPFFMIVRMLSNLLIDTILGAIPLVGDLFDFGFKANLKNTRMLQKHLDKKHGQRVDTSEPVR
ncbi:MAG: DUF4112 domain-containing protein [Henriciella sp.]|uniref:DUF4112 domain-containing protein n=1 Tax=Henriciella sp. TaxID=1968823 RepID=UPI002622EDBA|nr:DUF4112 domain-containing protein [Henriciella sp.]